MLQLGKDKRLNDYIDSNYAFRVLYAHEAIWKEQGLLTALKTSYKTWGRTLISIKGCLETLTGSCHALQRSSEVSSPN